MNEEFNQKVSGLDASDLVRWIEVALSVAAAQRARRG